jgi:tetratricopeptide (TPR) repeat protein
MTKFSGSFFLLLILCLSGYSQENITPLPESSSNVPKPISLLPASRANQIVSLHRQGKLDEAIELAEKEVAQWKTYSGSSAPYANSLFNLALLYREKAFALRKQLPGTSPEDSQRIAERSYDYLNKIGVYLRESVEVYDQTDAKETGAAIEAKNQLAWQLGHGQAMGSVSETDRARGDEAEKLYLEVLAIRTKKFSATDQDTLKIVSSLADLYVKRAKFEEALPLYDRYIAALENSPIKRDKELIPVLRTLAQICEITSRHDEALDLAKRIAAMTGAPENIPPPTPELSFRATRFEKISTAFPINFKNLPKGSSPVTISILIKTVAVRVLIDENGDVVEAKADPGDGQIKHLKKYEDLAMKSKFRPFIYKDVKYKMRGIVTYQWWD